MTCRLLLGIGPTRCGTTWLCELLKKRREFEFSIIRPKESHILDIDLPKYGAAVIEKHFPSSNNDAKYLCDFTSTYYDFYDFEISEIARRWPDAMIVAFIRDPVLRSISGVMRARKFSHIGNQRETKAGSWLEAIALNGPHARSQNNYDLNIERWRQYFPNNVHILSFDELEQDPESVIKSVFNILDVPSAESVRDSKFTKKVNISSDLKSTISVENELHLLNHWLSREMPASISASITDCWRERWLVRRHKLELALGKKKVYRVNTAVLNAVEICFAFIRFFEEIYAALKYVERWRNRPGVRTVEFASAMRKVRVMFCF